MKLANSNSVDMFDIQLVLGSDDTIKRLNSQLEFELTASLVIIQTYAFIPLDDYTEKMHNIQKQLQDIILAGRRIHERLISAVGSDDKLSESEVYYIHKELSKNILPKCNEYSALLYSALTKYLLSEKFDAEGDLEKCVEDLNDLGTKLINILIKIKTGENVNTKERTAFNKQLNDVFTKVGKKLLPVFFGFQYENALTIIEQRHLDEIWLNNLNARKKTLPHSKGYQYACAVKSLLYNEKTGLIKSYYQNITSEIDDTNLLIVLTNDLANITTPESAIQLLQDHGLDFEQQICAIESGLMEYGYFAGITSALIRLCTNTQYYVLGSLAYKSSSELLDDYISDLAPSKSVANFIDSFEASLKHTRPGYVIDYLLQHTDQLISKINPNVFMAVSLFATDRLTARWLSSTNFMLVYSLTNSFFSDLSSIIRIANRFNIGPKTTVNKIEPVAQHIVDFSIYMGLSVGKQLLKSEGRISNYQIVFIGMMYILSTSSRNIAGKIFDITAQLWANKKQRTSHWLAVLRVVTQYISSICFNGLSNFIIKQLFPPSELLPEQIKCLMEPMKCKDEALQVLNMDENLSYKQINPDYTRANTSEEFIKLAATKENSKPLHGYHPEFFATNIFADEEWVQPTYVLKSHIQPPLNDYIPSLVWNCSDWN